METKLKRKSRARQTHEQKPVVPVRYAAGGGRTRSTAVVISAASERMGVSAEYDYIGQVCGREGRDWFRMGQVLDPGRKIYDILKIRLGNGKTRLFYFDITAFFGRHGNRRLKRTSATDLPGYLKTFKLAAGLGLAQK
jgi:hypothetical protein